MDRLEQTILWRRLDSPGHDACGLWSSRDAWRVAGAAVFSSDGQPCRLSYAAECDGSWRTRSARVAGWMGRTVVEVEIKALPGGRWEFNGREQAELAGLVDVDLGFTPATNLIQLRRLSLEVGQGADAPAVYLHFPALTPGRLDQSYRRIALDRYDYRGPLFNYAGVLHVSDVGFVTRYPGLWEVESLL